ncbi:hypothetical protein DYB35_012675, partial [Aphanomyces astaci]
MEPNGTGESGCDYGTQQSFDQRKGQQEGATHGEVNGEQSLPDAWSEARRELLQRIQLDYPSGSEEKTKDDPNVASRLLLFYIRQYGIGGVAEYADRIAASLHLAVDQELHQPPKRPAPDASINVAKRTKRALSRRTHRSENKQAVLDGQRLYREKQRVVKEKIAVSAAKKKEYRQTKRAKKSQMRQADEQPQVEDFLMEFVPAQHPIIPEGPVL